MRLSRRDAMAALAAAGIGVGGVTAYRSDAVRRLRASDPDALETLLALAEVLYPSEVEATEEFVETYVFGRIEGDSKYEEEIGAAADALNDEALDREASSVVDLDPGERDALLRELELDETLANPEGSDMERIRYYLVDELLYALFTIPTGGELVGTENPTGHPGGLESYRRGPDG